MLPRFWMAGSRFTSTPRRGEGTRAAAQVDGHDGRQQLGREPDRQGDREEQRVDERTPERDVDGQDADDEEEDDPRDEQPEAADAALEVVPRRRSMSRRAMSP